MPAPKRRKGSQQNPEENKDEQAISESSLNKIVGAAEVYDLEVGPLNALYFSSEEFSLNTVLDVNNVPLFDLSLSLTLLGDGTPTHSQVCSETIPETSSVLDVRIGEGN